MQGVASDPSFVSNKLIAQVPGQSMPEERWPRRWRYLFVLGSAVLFWVAIWFLLRAL